LSITHHTRKRPSTGPRTKHGPQPRMTIGLLCSHFVALESWLQAHSIRYPWSSRDIKTKRVIVDSLCRSKLFRSELCWVLILNWGSLVSKLVRSGGLKWTILDPCSGLVILGSNWSACFLFLESSPCIAAIYLSHMYLSTTNIEHLGSITFSDMLKLISARREFTSYWNLLARFMQ
jgi:hypothetical protein